MNIHYLQHVPFEHPGSIAQWAASRNYRMHATRLYEECSFPAISQIDLLLILGGPMGVYDDERYPWLGPEKAFIGEVIRNRIPVVGICLGAQLLAAVLGSRIFPNDEKEIGWFPINRVSTNSPFAEILPSSAEVFHWHGDTFELPSNAVHLAASDACRHQAFAVDNFILGLQFHLETTPELAHSLLENCADELVNAPYIQPAEQLFDDPNRFIRINKLMEHCLDTFVTLSAS